MSHKNRISFIKANVAQSLYVFLPNPDSVQTPSYIYSFIAWNLILSLFYNYNCIIESTNNIK